MIQTATGGIPFSIELNHFGSFEQRSDGLTRIVYPIWIVAHAEYPKILEMVSRDAVLRIDLNWAGYLSQLIYIENILF